MNMESVLFLITVNLRALESATGDAAKQVVISGGLAGSDELCQRMADLAEAAIYRPQQSEATACGTAYLLAGCPQVWPEGLKGVWFYPKVNRPLANRFQHWQDKMQQALAKYPSNDISNKT